jgi:hypothetical protein
MQLQRERSEGSERSEQAKRAKRASKLRRHAPASASVSLGVGRMARGVLYFCRPLAWACRGLQAFGMGLQRPARPTGLCRPRPGPPRSSISAGLCQPPRGHGAEAALAFARWAGIPFVVAFPVLSGACFFCAYRPSGLTLGVCSGSAVDPLQWVRVLRTAVVCRLCTHRNSA